MLPPELSHAIEELAWPITPTDLARAAEEMSATYRGDAPASFAPDTAARRAAYAVLRMPATYAAARGCIAAIEHQLPGFSPSSLLDLGAGPGTMVWAAQESWDGLARATLVEREAGFIALGRQLGAAAPHLAAGMADWRAGDLRWPSSELPTAELVTVSYVMGEMAPAERAAVVDLAWQKTSGVLLLIEPGTPRGFAAIVAAREALLARGDAHVVAPCSHGGGCPLLAEGEWCHFAARFPRSARHRSAKGGTLGYEDEKYSWLAVSREPLAPRGHRILQPPGVSKAAVTLRLCEADATRREAVPRRAGEPFKIARRASWGDCWEE